MVPGLSHTNDGAIRHVITSDQTNYNVGSAVFGAGGLADPVALTCIVPAAVTVNSAKTGAGSFSVPAGPAALNLNDFALGSLVVLVVAGKIKGAGGSGGRGATNGSPTYTHAGGGGGAGDLPGLGADQLGQDGVAATFGAGSTPVAAILGHPATGTTGLPGEHGGHAVEADSSCNLLVYNRGEIWGGGGGGGGGDGVGAAAGTDAGDGGLPGESGEIVPGAGGPAGYAVRCSEGGPNGTGQAGIVQENTGTIKVTVDWP